MPENLDTSQIKNWRSIITLVVFVFTSKSSICLERSGPLPLTPLPPHRYHCTFSLSCPHLPPPCTYRRRLECTGCLTNHTATAGPLSARFWRWSAWQGPVFGAIQLPHELRDRAVDRRYFFTRYTGHWSTGSARYINLSFNFF